jgi:flagellar hook-associated protein 2
MADIFNVGNEPTQLDSLVEAYKATFRPQVDRLERQKSELERSSRFYTNLNSRMNAFISELDRFERDDAADEFTAKQVTSSQSDYVTASATSEAIDGINSVFVKQLAESDVLLSGRLDSDDEFGIEGEQTLTFDVNGESKNVTVTFDGTETNKEAINKIVTAINDAEIGFVAGSVSEFADSTRLTLRSDETGSDYQIKFEDSDVFKKIGLENKNLYKSSDDDDETGSNSIERTIQAGAAGGFKVANTNELNAVATVNGLDVTRSSNTMDDVLQGVSFTLNKVNEVGDDDVILSTDVNASNVENFIKPFVDSYNNLMNFLTSDRDLLRSDAALNSVQFQLRSVLTDRVAGLNEGDPEFITGFGIDIESGGRLSIGDREQVEDVLKENPESITNFFLADGGFIDKVQNIVDRLKGEDNLITERTLSIADQIDSQQDRIDNLQARIDRQGEIQRKQYTTLLDAFFNAQNQFNSFQQAGLAQGF